ncbi:MAG: transporter [Saprospiraceae bacterium]|nr:transporter [Saprospiraceae bacterium]
MKEQINPAERIDPTKEDFGFGKSYNQTQNRMITDDGKFNILRIGVPGRSQFHELIEMSWIQFLLLIVLYYIVINLIFGSIYYLIGSEQIMGVEMGSKWTEFYQCFFFSVQTFTTVGYGGLHPKGFLISGIAGMEALAGLLTFAIITGLVYAKFSKPQAKILYSKNVLIAPFKEGYGLQLRIANALTNTLIDMEANLIISFTPEDSNNRILRNLPLEINKIALFPLNWTLNHAIDEKSPLYELQLNEVSKYHMEVLVMIKGFDETYNQMVHSMQSYHYESIIYNAKFQPMFEYIDGKTILYLDKLDDFNQLN